MSRPQPALHLVLTSSVLLILVSARVDKLCTLQDTTNSIGHCGSQFANVLALICGPGGYNKRAVKRDAGEQEQIGGPEDYFMSKSAALSFTHPDFKRSHSWKTVGDKLVFDGPTCECCHNRCTPFEMAQYCKNPNGALMGVMGLGKGR